MKETTADNGDDNNNNNNNNSNNNNNNERLSEVRSSHQMLGSCSLTRQGEVR